MGVNFGMIIPTMLLAPKRWRTCRWHMKGRGHVEAPHQARTATLQPSRSSQQELLSGECDRSIRKRWQHRDQRWGTFLPKTDTSHIGRILRVFHSIKWLCTDHL